jgi:Flp pilus assembly protein TadD/mono/diheme cytochrome c family protein
MRDSLSTGAATSHAASVASLGILVVVAAIAAPFAAAPNALQPDAAATPTFARDIAPILFARCITCHHPGGPAPFSLLTHAEARQRATLIAAVTQSRFMPPWKASRTSGPFVGQHPLSEDEIDRIARWAAAGAPEGDRRHLPRAPRLAEGWLLGNPDLIVSPAQPYTLAADGTDVFRIFVIPLPTRGSQLVRAVEFRPGNPAVVHHANLRLDRTETSRRYDADDPQPGYDGLIAHSASFPEGHFLGWTPGQVAPLLPKGLAWPLEEGTDLVVELHMRPSGKTETVLPSIGFYFGGDPPERMPVMLRLGRQSIDIPPGEASYTITDSFVLPVDVDVLAVQPHAHQRARQVTGVAMLPDGTTRRLIEIDDWDFRWQHVYRFVSPLSLPRGTTLSLRYTFDNSATNPRNPVLPPRRVVWGQRSADEMGDLWIQVLTRTPRDRDTLVEAVRPKVLAEDAVGYERMIASEPDDVALRNDVAQVYLELGRPAEAAAHFAAVARLVPDSPRAQFNLGTALAVAGRTNEALDRFRQALRLDPRYGPAHNNLGGILLQHGRADEALDHLREAVRLDEANVQAHTNLADAYAMLGRFDLAVRAVETALRLTPAEPMSAALRTRLTAYRRRQVLTR